ncbi:magnesium transporter CorA family protein [Methylobrevis pamukkalensis]|uniref:Magnesium transport protein CorA n=1 Tax=Methylobrevis pamukkalensis TaxID=1439726 RepID=A0A1E3H2K1_9HYPH|nr:magnesium transporter CorA family protein [Methylobrevis pamukkalensis]ODN69761.1 Magnesium transport protein CorA [Methylobrevis pamukkalensis]
MMDLFRPADDHLVREVDCDRASLDPAVVWVDLLRPTREEDDAVTAFLGAELLTREEMEEIEPSSRLSAENGTLYMTAQILCRSETASPTTTPVTFILAGGRLATLRYDDTGTLPAAIARLTKSGSGAVTGAGTLLILLDAAIDRLADVLERTGANVDRLARSIFEEGIAGNLHRTILRNIGGEGMRIGHIQESLTSLSRLLLFLTEKADRPDFGKTDKLRLKTMARDAKALTDHSHALEGRINFLLDATLGFVGIEQNAIIKIFSVLAVIFMPPTLVASIYGMNFRVMPELDWTYGYPMALGIMVMSAVGTFLLFRWQKWL